MLIKFLKIFWKIHVLKKQPLNFSYFSDLFELVSRFLRGHKLLFMTCVGIIFIQSVVLGSLMSAAVPLLSSFLNESPPESGTGFWGFIYSTYKIILDLGISKEVQIMIALVGGSLINSSLEYISLYFNGKLTNLISVDCRSQVFGAVLNAEYSEIIHQPKGYFVQILTTEVRAVYMLFKQTLSTVISLTNGLVLFVLLLSLSVKLTLVLLAGIFVIITINFFLTRKIKIIGQQALAQRTHLSSFLTDAVWGIKQIKLMNASRAIHKSVDGISKESEGINFRLALKNGLLPLVSENLLSLCLVLLIVVWYKLPVFSDDIPKISGFLTFLLVVFKLAPILSALSREYGMFYTNIPPAMRVLNFLRSHEASTNPQGIDPNPFFSSSIKIENVNFEYGSGKNVFRNLNLEIQKGSYIGIVGPSGHGKTTLFNLLVGLYKPSSGQVLIDGIPLLQFNLTYLRTKIGILSQDFFIFNTSIKENMLLANPSASEAEMWSALEKANLKDFVSSLPNGLDTLTGNNGEKLSGGQRQRLSLSLLFLNDPEIIILDEGTSAIDRQSEDLVLSSLKQLHLKGKTIIASAHKKTALADAEIVYEIREGVINQTSN